MYVSNDARKLMFFQYRLMAHENINVCPSGNQYIWIVQPIKEFFILISDLFKNLACIRLKWKKLHLCNMPIIVGGL